MRVLKFSLLIILKLMFLVLVRRIMMVFWLFLIVLWRGVFFVVFYMKYWIEWEENMKIKE